IGLVRLSHMIKEHCGLSFNERLSTLKKKVSNRVTELGVSFSGYCDYLIQHPVEWDVMIELVTINETYFYREENQLIECSSVVLPMLKKKIFGRPIRIWSAACSTGEEPYTLAMLIHETGLFSPGSVEIIATDINKKVLEKANMGWYHQGSFAFRRIPENLLKKYFTQKDSGYQINDSIKKMINFQHLNLLNKQKAAQVGEVDVIFCRNVLIYFDQETTRQVIQSLHKNLSPDGYLFLGHAESITDTNLGFQKAYSEKTFYYRKETDQDETVPYISSR
ncbi:protein-glutamate O-methyltransferase CheR, partial [Neobacillus niacini]|uniref:CheR family methyltransferase n=1 Tax=Neobacillus niacini TaxID=86668 RepID=UPI0030006458